MSLQGEINKVQGDVFRAINQIAHHGLINRQGAIVGTQKIHGYVCAINEEGELAGTVNVQEFYGSMDDYDGVGIGLHEGVLLSAIQNNEDGVMIVPLLYSEVIIVSNPTDHKEYVLMYSHAKRVQLKSHNEIEIGVTEYEDFVETSEGLEKDFFELEPTKNKTVTNYTVDTIQHQVTSPNDETGLIEKLTAEKKTITVGKTKITIDGDNVQIETDSKVSFKVGSTTITEEDGKVNIKTNNAKIDTTSCEIKGSNIKVDGNITMTGGTLKTGGVAAPTGDGPYNAIPVCPFSGAPHCGSIVSGT